MKYIDKKEIRRAALKMLILLFLLILPLTNAAADYMKADDGARIYYDIQGEGNEETIVFIHGLLVNSLFWSNNVSKLAQSYQVITIDMRGHGYTVDYYVADYTLERVARDVKLLLDNLNVDSATLVGWSTGAFVSYKYVELFGKYKLNGICSVDMPPKTINENGWHFGSYNRTDFEQLSATIPGADFELRRSFVSQVYAEGATVSKSVLDFTERNFLLSPAKAFISYMEQLASHDFRSLLKKLPVPHLYLYGSKSLLYPSPADEWLEENLPDYPQNKTVAFTESGHTPHMEETEKFNKVIKGFVKSLNN